MGGLGSFSASASSLQQTAFLCAFARALRSSTDKNQRLRLSKLECFEPMLSETEARVLCSLGATVLSEDAKGAFGVEAEAVTFCFLPHAPRFLYSNLLTQNWHSLGKLCIFGNSFEQYRHLTVSGDEDAVSKLNARGGAHELCFDDCIRSESAECADSVMGRQRAEVMANAFAFQKLIHFPST